MTRAKRSPKWMLGASGVPTDWSGRDEVRPASNLQCRIRAVHYAGGQPHGSRPDPWDMHAPSQAVKDRVTARVRKVEGVKDVVNNLEIQKQ